MRVQSWKCGADGTPIGTACGDPVFLAALSKTITEAFRSESFNPMAGTAPARSHPGSNSRSPEGFVEYRLSRHRCCGPRIHHYPCRLLTLLEQETREGEAAAKRKAHTAIIRRPKNQKEGVARPPFGWFNFVSVTSSSLLLSFWEPEPSPAGVSWRRLR